MMAGQRGSGGGEDYSVISRDLFWGLAGETYERYTVTGEERKFGDGMPWVTNRIPIKCGEKQEKIPIHF